MKNYFFLLRKGLKQEPLKEDEFMEEEMELTPESIARLLNIQITEDDIKRIDRKKRSYQLKNKIYFIPPNDGYQKNIYKYYQNNKVIIDNQTAFSQITNLDEILIQMVKIFEAALDNDIVLDPYSFMLELTEPTKKIYNGKAKLLMTETAIKNEVLNENTFEEATIYFINMFLDNFMCYNFGKAINRNEKLEEELNKLNEKVISLTLREEFEIDNNALGKEEDQYQGIEYYYLPVNKTKARKRNKQ